MLRLMSAADSTARLTISGGGQQRTDVGSLGDFSVFPPVQGHQDSTQMPCVCRGSACARACEHGGCGRKRAIQNSKHSRQTQIAAREKRASMRGIERPEGGKGTHTHTHTLSLSLSLTHTHTHTHAHHPCPCFQRAPRPVRHPYPQPWSF